MNLTDEQLDAIADATDAEAGLLNKEPAEVAAILAERGHPAFAGAGADPFGVGPPPGAKQEAPPASAAKAQAPAEQKATPAAPSDNPYGDYLDDGMEEEFDDPETPRWKIKQATSEFEDPRWADEIKDGTWYRSDDPSQNSAERDFVFVAVVGHRALSAPYDDPEGAQALRAKLQTLHAVAVPPDHKGPYCASDDRERPRDQGFGVLNGGTCKDCQHAQWRKVGEGSEAKRVKDCDEIYTFLVYDVQAGLPGSPGLVDFTRTGYKAGRKLLTRLKALRLAQGLPMFGFRVTLGSIKPPGKKYFVPDVGTPVRLEKAELDAWLPLYHRENRAFGRGE